MKTRGLRLAALGATWAAVLWGVAGFADPAGGTLRSPSGAWSVQPPAGWTPDPVTENDSGADSLRLTGPEGPLTVLRIETLRQPMPMAALIEQIRSSFRQRGFALDNESETVCGERKAWGYEYQEADEQLPFRVLQVLVDGGAIKVLVSLTSPEPVSPQARAVLPEILASLTLSDPDARTPRFEPHTFAAYGLAIDLPAGGTARETPLEVNVEWTAAGVSFRAARMRTPLSPDDWARWDTQGFDADESGGFAVDGLTQDSLEVAGKPAILTRFHLAREGVRYLTTVMLYRISGKGEIASLGFGFVGERPPGDLLPWEQCLAAARVEPMLGPLPERPPTPAEPVEVWGGRARVRIPARWATVPEYLFDEPEGAPRAEHGLRWSPERAPDLGVRMTSGSCPGGAAAFEAWLQSRRWRKRDVARVESGNELKAGSRPARAWRVTHGPTQDRRQTEIVAIFEADRFYAIETTFPAVHKGLFSGLAEKIAPTTEWSK